MTEKKSAGALPFVGSMGDSVDFVRRMWGATGLPGLPSVGGIAQFAQGLPQSLPGMVVPTLDLNELDRRIADLRAVEQWLALNGNMLHATIQSLEVQRNTIATLKNLGGSMLSTVTRSAAPPAADTGAEMVRQAQARTAARRSAAPAAPVPLSQPAPAAPAGTARRRRPKATTKATAVRAAMPIDPAAWWNLLHEQFARVAAVAAAEAARTEAPPPGKSRGKRTRAPADAGDNPASASARQAAAASAAAPGAARSPRPARSRRPAGADKA